MDFINIWAQLLRGKTLGRALMNLECRRHHISGKVADIGSGEGSSYLGYLKNDKAELVSLDNYRGGQIKVNFETDPLPFQTEELDGVLLFNVLEHIYNYENLIGEAHRALKSGGSLFGFVPFLVGYHPDPRDYWRYTSDSLGKIFAAAEFGKVEVNPAAFGPFSAALNIVLSLPKPISTVFALSWPIVWALDSFVGYLNPAIKTRYPLGYFFSLTK